MTEQSNLTNEITVSNEDEEADVFETQYARAQRIAKAGKALLVSGGLLMVAAVTTLAVSCHPETA
ncbi:MAG: hypothetical protein GY804_12020 [Alphaproteobacteria bacterium]|nr:hypothetical protein [Alphaproteobacteria bacterium]